MLPKNIARLHVFWDEDEDWTRSGAAPVAPAAGGGALPFEEYFEFADNRGEQVRRKLAEIDEEEAMIAVCLLRMAR